MKLYRYRKINPYTVDEIVNHYLVFSSPILFNDIFDCQIPVDASRSANHFPEDLNSLIESVFVDDDEYKDLLKQRMLHDPVKNEEEYFEQVVKMSMERQRIICFTDDFCNFPMWAHYADDNRGLCLEFTVNEKENSFWGLIEKVRYTDTIPIIGYPEDLSDSEKYFHVFKEQVLTKHEKWSYENEHRIVLLDSATEPLSDSGLGKVLYEPQLLTAVYFGHNVNESSDEYKTIVSALKQREKAPDLLVRRKNRAFFGTHWEPIE